MTTTTVIIDKEMQSWLEYFNTRPGAVAIRAVRNGNKIGILVIEDYQPYSVICTDGENKYETTESWAALLALASGQTQIYL